MKRYIFILSFLNRILQNRNRFMQLTLGCSRFHRWSPPSGLSHFCFVLMNLQLFSPSHSFLDFVCFSVAVFSVAFIFCFCVISVFAAFKHLQLRRVVDTTILDYLRGILSICETPEWSHAWEKCKHLHQQNG